MDKNLEQMSIRQSAPKPTIKDYKSIMPPNMSDPSMSANSTVDGFRALQKPIGREAIQKATLILQKYKEGKAKLEQRIIEDEQWYKLRHWECMRKNAEDIEPTSAWLFNSLANKHADAMDNVPSPNILPREEGDKAEAEMLTSIIPVILDQNDFESTYDDVMSYKLKTGTGVYGVLWDASKLNGLGDISIEKVDIINLFWESGIRDIQKSRNLFHVTLVDNDVLESKYPQLVNKLGTSTIDVAKYVYDDNVDTTEKSVVVDWYYKKANSQGKQILHFCKFVNDVVLSATENEPEYANRGLYDHGKYPFVFDPLFKVEGTPTGFGYVDVGKNAQEYIDRGNQAILMNMLSNTKPRFFIRDDGAVSESEYADMSKDFVHVDGNLSTDSIVPINGKPLSDIYVNVITQKIDELKETTGNRDISSGGTTSGVTAASAIAAMQEAGSKLSRDSNKASYRAFKQIVLLMIELIRQFYSLPRCFRIMGQNGMIKFVSYSNAGIVPQYQGIEFGIDLGSRVPLFDVEVTAQKSSPYSKMAQNELALQFYGAGFFDPQMSDQALACLEMMDFERKDFIMQKIAENGAMYQQMLTLQMASGIAPIGTSPDVSEIEALGGETGEGEADNTKKARQRVADSTSPT